MRLCGGLELSVCLSGSKGAADPSSAREQLQDPPTFLTWGLPGVSPAEAGTHGCDAAWAVVNKITGKSPNATGNAETTGRAQCTPQGCPRNTSQPAVHEPRESHMNYQSLMNQESHRNQVDHSWIMDHTWIIHEPLINHESHLSQVNHSWTNWITHQLSITIIHEPRITHEPLINHESHLNHGSHFPKLWPAARTLRCPCPNSLEPLLVCTHTESMLPSQRRRLTDRTWIS